MTYVIIGFACAWAVGTVILLVDGILDGDSVWRTAALALLWPLWVVIKLGYDALAFIVGEL